jgi:cellulose synthase/poly-beta-1,6-N-acetylglucosamine synthase-like glycosyltransferase
MMIIAEILWWLSLGALLGYHLIVFRIRETRKPLDHAVDLPGVSIVIAIKNGTDRLMQHLGQIMAQDYPLFEIILVDDHSRAEEKRKLEDAVSAHPRISLYHSALVPGKKQALSFGIEKAKHPLILCTDADCTPAGPEWIKQMVMHSTGQDLVLGYSPYASTVGKRFIASLLNFCVRFETVMTGIQYLSWAMTGKPYMGVGRNMLYPRALFQEVNPFKDHAGIPYGDDDLWVQQAASMAKVSVAFDKASHVYSDPPQTWGEWLRQKHRHMSAGHHYQKKRWWQPAVYGVALIVHWALLPFFIPFATDSMMFVALILGLAVRWDTYRKWTFRLGDRDTAMAYPLLEVGYALYLAGMGVVTLLAKKKTWN